MNLDKELFKLVGQKQKMAFQIYFNADSTISHFIVKCSRNGNSVCELFSKFNESNVYDFLLEYMKLYHGSFPLAKVEDSDKLFTIFQTPKNKTELLRILSEIYYNQQTKNVKNIYSFVGSLDCYDFGARVYDPAVGRFTTPDPLAWDTPEVSPYVYCAANPIRHIDPTGDNIAVLNYEDGINQYLAILIQDEEGMWRYYSMNGDWVYSLTLGSLGGKGYHDRGETSFANPQQFLDSSYNNKGNADTRASNQVNGYNLTEAYEIKTKLPLIQL